MYRLIFLIVVVLAVALGLLVGTLNSDITRIDLLWLQLDWPLGLIVLCAAACGLLLGVVLTWLFSVLPMRSRLGRESADSFRRG